MHGKFIKAAIESVLGQTFRDYEIIVVDDGSPDNTPEEVSKIKDERLKYVRQKPSGLPANSRNTGIRLATGRLIAFFDGDDIWHPDKLEKCREVLSKDPNIDILCHDVNFLNSDSGKIFRRSHYGPYGSDMYTQLLLEGNALCPTSTVIKRSVFADDGFNFSEDKRLFTVEDYDMWLKLAKSKRYNFFHLPEPLAEHRVFEGSATLMHIEKQALNMIYLFDENLKDIELGRHYLKRVIRKRKAQVLFGAALTFNYRKMFGKSVRWHLKAIKEFPLYLKPYLTLIPTVCRVKLGYL